MSGLTEGFARNKTKTKSMKTITVIFKLWFVVMLVAASGCSKSHPPDLPTLQGNWTGRDSQANTAGSPTLVVSGTNLEFHGADTNEWYKATFTLREDTNPKQLLALITDCPFPQYVGKTSKAIYRMEDGALRMAANEPGNPAAPAGFDTPGLRQVVFKLDKP
jgi:uncharacterized protein (TIGR03067 family)